MDTPTPAVAQRSLDAEPEEGPLQFSLRGLLILQAVCAIFFAALVNLGIFALIVAFIATVILGLAPVRAKNVRLSRMGFDIMGGLVLPGLCLTYDPGLLSANSLASFVYLGIAVQMIALLVWLLCGPIDLGPFQSVFQSLMTGILAFGSFLAGIVGCILLPFSLIGTVVMGIGVLGFTPFITSYVFGRNALKASRDLFGKRAWSRPGLLFVFALGIFLSVAAPLALTALAGPEIAKWLQGHLPKRLTIL
jgi:hypothetical protein